MNDATSMPLVTAWTEVGVGRVMLSDPAHRNVLTRAMSDQIAAAVATVLAADVGAIVLTAEPPVFCAGGSLDDLLRPTLSLADSYAGQQALAAAPVPTIAAVGAPAIGAGCNLPLACDVILATPAARFDPRFLDVGIHPGGGHLWRLVQRIGTQGAAAMSLCGDVLTGEEAAVAGLAWRCVPDDELEAVAMTLATRAANRSRPLVQRTKDSLRRGAATADVSAAAAIELEAQQWSVQQPAFAESVQRIKDQLAARDR